MWSSWNRIQSALDAKYKQPVQPRTEFWLGSKTPGHGTLRLKSKKSHAEKNSEVYTMMKTMARRLKRLEELEFQHRAELGPSLAAILLERRRKRAIAEGREPEPDPPPGRLIDSRGRLLSLADLLLQHRKKRETN